MIVDSTAGGWCDYHGSPQAMLGVYAAVSLCLLLVWLMYVKPGWVRVPASAYAERLLESTELLPSKRSRPARRNQKSKSAS